MNTPNLDALINRSVNRDISSYEDSIAHRKFCALFGTHGPALVAALKEIHALSSPSEGRITFDPIGWNLRIHQIATDVLAKLDQEAKG